MLIAMNPVGLNLLEPWGSIQPCTGIALSFCITCGLFFPQKSFIAQFHFFISVQ
jgi:hypothetical protein